MTSGIPKAPKQRKRINRYAHNESPNLWTATEKNQLYRDLKAGIPFEQMKTRRTVKDLKERCDIYGWVYPCK